MARRQPINCRPMRRARTSSMVTRHLVPRGIHHLSAYRRFALHQRERERGIGLQPASGRPALPFRTYAPGAAPSQPANGTLSTASPSSPGGSLRSRSADAPCVCAGVAGPPRYSWTLSMVSSPISRCVVHFPPRMLIMPLSASNSTSSSRMSFFVSLTPWAADQRTNTRESADHLVGAKGRTQVWVELAQQILDFLPRHHHLFAGRVTGIGGADQETSIPRNGEDNAAVLGSGNQERVVFRKAIEGKQDVHAFAGTHARRGLRRGQLPHDIGKRAGRIDK